MTQIRERYPNEWVLVEYDAVDDDLRVLEGNVLAHSASKAEVYAAQRDLRGRKLAIEYTGEIPEDFAVLF